MTARRPVPIFLATSSIVKFRRIRAVRRLSPRRVTACSTGYGGACSSWFLADMFPQEHIKRVKVLLKAYQISLESQSYAFKGTLSAIICSQGNIIARVGAASMLVWPQCHGIPDSIAANSLRLQWKFHDKHGTAARCIRHLNLRSMRLDDFRDDRKAQSCARATYVAAAPESLENMLPV